MRRPEEGGTAVLSPTETRECGVQAGESLKQGRSTSRTLGRAVT